MITTAAVPGRKSPILVTTAMVEAMAEGSLIIDMAADGGGNCELTKVGEVVDAPGRAHRRPGQSARRDGRARQFHVRQQRLEAAWRSSARRASWPRTGTTRSSSASRVARDGAINHAATAEALGLAPTSPSTPEVKESADVNVLLQYATVLILTAFVGTEIISKVPSILHTPLMSGSNAIHGVIIVGSMLILGSATTNLRRGAGLPRRHPRHLNVVGGFVVTDRMLEMFKARKPKAPDAKTTRTPREPRNAD